MFYRGRRLRNNEVTRGLMRETHLHANQLIYPIFVVEGENIKNEIFFFKRYLFIIQLIV